MSGFVPFDERKTPEWQVKLSASAMCAERPNIIKGTRAALSEVKTDRRAFTATDIREKGLAQKRINQ